MNITQLGNKVEQPSSPEQAIIECIPVKLDEIKNSAIQYDCPEVSSLCPVTGQPDFAQVYITIVPDAYLPESKSLKLFLTSFRNHGGFHEPTTVYIGTRLYEVCLPKFIRVNAIWNARGGIAINVHWQKGDSGSIVIPEFSFEHYKGRM